MLKFCGTVFIHKFFLTALIPIFYFCQNISHHFKNQEQKLRFGIEKFYFLWFIFQNDKTEYNYFNFISIIATPLFLIAQSNITYHFFLKLNNSLKQTDKYKKWIQHYSFICKCPGLSNGCTLGLANRLAGRFAPATELELNRFRNFSFGELLWHLSTQLNNSDISSYINFFYPRSGKRSRLIPFLVYSLVYLSIASNLVTLDTLSPWYESVCTHT